MKNWIALFSLPVLLISASACARTAAPAEETAAVEATRVQSTAPTETATLLPAASPVPDEAAPQLSDQPYTSPSGAFSIYFPSNWNCSETGFYRVDCQSPDSAASIIVRAVATGYELQQPHFEDLAYAETVVLYSEKKAYSETEKENEEGEYRTRASWREAGTQWQSEDRFYRRGDAVYHISFAAHQDRWEDFLSLFEAVRERANFSPEGLSGAPLYALKREYTSPDVLFTVEVPTSWSKYIDIASIEKTRLEGFLSPDQHAAVQVAVYSQGSVIKQEAKATKTMEIMRNIYGNNLRILSDKALPDGREKLEWNVENKELSGRSYFGSYAGSLYIFSIVWDDATAMVYSPVLEEISDSFTLK